MAEKRYSGDSVMAAVKQPKWVAVSVVIFIATLLAVGGVIGWLVASCDEQIGDAVLASRVLSTTAGPDEISSIIIVDKENYVSKAISGRGISEFLYEYKQSTVSNMPSEITIPPENLLITIEASAGERCSLSFAEFSDGIYFGSACLGRNDPAWWSPADNLYTWTVARLNTSSN
ncbi:MAG: hypothetical protein ACX94C_05625 [Phycisphaerales bacterium]